MMNAMRIKQYMKKMTRRGTDPLAMFNGIFSATSKMKTMDASINVNATPILKSNNKVGFTLNSIIKWSRMAQLAVLAF